MVLMKESYLCWQKSMLDFTVMEENEMKIAVLSGKGGTGKTLVSVNLAASAKGSSYIDCDVEEPNGHLFFMPEDIESEQISIKIPFVDEKLCTGCRICVEFCKFNALAYINSRLIIFDEVCHSCGGCVLFCPEKALAERENIIGDVQRGVSEKVAVITGILHTGKESDGSPGIGCPVIASLSGVDMVLIVAEPSVSGVSDMERIIKTSEKFQTRNAICINKYDINIENTEKIESFCQKLRLPFVGRISFDPDAVRTINNGRSIVELDSIAGRAVKDVFEQTIYMLFNGS